MNTKIHGGISSIESYRRSDVSEKVRITADYECANILSTLTFEVPFADASHYFVGQKVAITVSIEQ